VIDPRDPDYASTPVAPTRPGFGYALDPGAEAAGPLAPVVSVVTPFYNTGPVFHETAACLLGEDGAGLVRCAGQSLRNFEWIIVNDGSRSAEALAVLEPYRRLGERGAWRGRVRVIDHAVNHGLPAARNTGWRAARGRYVFFLDSDDLVEPTTLEKCALYLACNPGSAFVKGLTVGFGAQEYLWDKGFHNGPGFLEENLATATAMVRRDALHEVGGFDESIRGGMEDWEFWLRCAALGRWGSTVPEHLDWYRRRDAQHASWDNIADARKRGAFLERVRAAHPGLFEGPFPSPERPWHMPFEHPAGPLEAEGFVNPLAKARPRLLMIVPWLRMGGADRFNLDLARYLTRDAGWEVTVAATLPGHPWLPEFTRLTPDVFCLDHLGRPPEFPRLLDYLVGSRRPDVVMVTNSQLGYFLLPYLRSRHPGPAYVDFNHMEEPHWQNGGHPRTGAGFQDQLDLSITVSGHLKRWMCASPRSADPSRVEVCHINADSATFRPDAAARAEVRGGLGLADDEPVILYAARLCPQKQPLVFGRTMELLAKRGARFTALVAGDGDMLGALESIVRSAGLGERVRFLGPVAAAKMPGLMAASDVFFLPSQWEGIALSIYEAMAAGLAVVGADVGGQAELVTPGTGVLLAFPERGEELEARAYAEALAELLADPGRVRALGEAARERIREHFELDSMGRRMLALFERARALHEDFPRPPVSPGLAREMALLGVEMLRVQDLCDYLWPYRDRYRRLTGELAGPGDAALEAQARAQLEHLENSRAWRLVSAVKAAPPYRLLARVRYGPGWDRADPGESPAARLARLRASRSYRLIQTMKRVPPWSIYTRIRHGGAARDDAGRPG
jgi:glycosyltransferase involved in cell wall biosynthesis/GT2 family glycosyltransferase